MEKKKHINAKEPLVSIITPLFNAEKFITHTIESVLAQTYVNWEMLIIDDASTDAGPIIAKNYEKKDIRIQLKSLRENQGAGICRNTGTEMAKGHYIAFLDSDDVWHPEKLNKQINLMLEQEQDVCYSSYQHIDQLGNPLQKRVKALPRLTYKKQLRNNYIGNLTGIYNAKKLGKIYSPKIKKRQDWALWLEAIKRSNKPAIGIQEDLAFYRVHEQSLSSNKFKLIPYNYHFYRKVQGFSALKSIAYLLVFFWEYFFKRPMYIEHLQ